MNSCTPSFTSWAVPIAMAAATQATVTPSISCLARRLRAGRSINDRLLHEGGTPFGSELLDQRHVAGGEDRDQHDRDDGPQRAVPPGSPRRVPPPTHRWDAHEGEWCAHSEGEEKDRGQAEQQEEVDQHGPPDDVGEALHRLPVPAEDRKSVV